MKNRLLVLSAAIGAGHVKAGEALCEAYTQYYGGEAQHMDFFRYSSPTFSRWVEQTYYLVTKHTPSVYKYLYRLADRPTSPVTHTEIYWGLKKYRQLIKEYRPDAIISTHFLPAAVVSHMYPRFPIPNGVVLTDYVAHWAWASSNTTRYFVAHDGIARELQQMGIEPSRIQATGIPIRPCFSQLYNRQELRAKLGMDPSLPLFLIMSGGNAVGPLVEVLQEMSQINADFQVAAIAGRNQRSFHELQRVLVESGLRGRVLGFVDNIHEWMATSDLLISKAGGLTVTEALAVGLPMLIVRPTPGQEDGNTQFLTSAGAAKHIKNISELTPAISALLENPGQIKIMSHNAKKLARPKATEQILTSIEQIIAQSRCCLQDISGD